MKGLLNEGGNEPLSPTGDERWFCDKPLLQGQGAFLTKSAKVSQHTQ